MISVLLSILKFIGLILLIVLGLIILILLLVLLVPVRYRILIHRKTEEENPVNAVIKLSWLLHILNFSYTYPDAAYVRGKILCFTVYRSDQEKKNKKGRKKESAAKEENSEATAKNEAATSEATAKNEAATNEATEKTKTTMKIEEAESSDRKEGENEADDLKKRKTKKASKNIFKRIKEKLKAIIDFAGKIWKALKNIKYTIKRICDKIKHIVKNIKYYMKILQSDVFERSWTLCSERALKLLKSIRPRKVKGMITIGTGDPASTAQILSVFGILYPVIGAGITVNPDFQQIIFEGDLLIKGRITLFTLVRTGAVLYFNRDLRRLIKLFNREVA